MKAGSGIDPRIRQRRVAVARHRGRRRLGIVVAGVIVVVVVLGGLGLLHSGLFSAKKVVVTGNHPHISTATILAAAGLAGHPPLISVNTGVVAAKVEKLPWIATARVSRNWPDHITIAVAERVPVASMAGPGTSWSEVDGAGRTVQVDAARVIGFLGAAADSEGDMPQQVGLGAVAAHAAIVADFDASPAADAATVERAAAFVGAHREAYQCATSERSDEVGVDPG